MQQMVRNQFSYVICTWEYSFVFSEDNRLKGELEVCERKYMDMKEELEKQVEIEVGRSMKAETAKDDEISRLNQGG